MSKKIPVIKRIKQDFINYFKKTGEFSGWNYYLDFSELPPNPTQFPIITFQTRVMGKQNTPGRDCSTNMFREFTIMILTNNLNRATIIDEIENFEELLVKLQDQTTFFRDISENRNIVKCEIKDSAQARVTEKNGENIKTIANVGQVICQLEYAL